MIRLNQRCQFYFYQMTIHRKNICYIIFSTTSTAKALFLASCISEYQYNTHLAHCCYRSNLHQTHLHDLQSKTQSSKCMGHISFLDPFFQLNEGNTFILSTPTHTCIDTHTPHILNDGSITFYSVFLISGSDWFPWSCWQSWCCWPCCEYCIYILKD